MNVLFLLLLLAAVVCFGIAAFAGHGRTATRADGAVVTSGGFARVNFVALGLLFAFLVPLIQQFN